MEGGSFITEPNKRFPLELLRQVMLNARLGMQIPGVGQIGLNIGNVLKAPIERKTHEKEMEALYHLMPEAFTIGEGDEAKRMELPYVKQLSPRTVQYLMMAHKDRERMVPLGSIPGAAKALAPHLYPTPQEVPGGLAEAALEGAALGGSAGMPPREASRAGLLPPPQLVTPPLPPEQEAARTQLEGFKVPKSKSIDLMLENVKRQGEKARVRHIREQMGPAGAAIADDTPLQVAEKLFSDYLQSKRQEAGEERRHQRTIAAEDRRHQTQLAQQAYQEQQRLDAEARAEGRKLSAEERTLAANAFKEYRAALRDEINDVDKALTQLRNEPPAIGPTATAEQTRRRQDLELRRRDLEIMHEQLLSRAMAGQRAPSATQGGQAPSLTQRYRR